MLEYARWKYVLVGVVVLIALVFALPNVFGDDEALLIATQDHSAVTAAGRQAVEAYLKEKKIQYKADEIDDGRLVVRFTNVTEQLQARDVVNEHFSKDYITAVSFASRAPQFLRNLGIKPMALGLDLRGGLYLLYQVDVNSSVSQLLDGYEGDARRALTTANVPFKDVSKVNANSTTPNAIRIVLPPEADATAARTALTQTFQGLNVTTESLPSGAALTAALSPSQVRDRIDYAISQSLTTLRNRVNQLGVSEPTVVRQGVDRINVQLPGVSNSAEVKALLGRTATLEFRLQDETHSATDAAITGKTPLGAKLYTKTRFGGPILLKREIIVTGDQLTSATPGQGDQGAEVNVKLDSRAGDNMFKTTRQNVGRHMAAVLIEKRPETTEENGQKVTRVVTDETVINNATIQSAFGNQFRITGLAAGEARDLSLLLRSGSLPTAIYPVEERTIGPTLGRENIDRGVLALEIGMAGVFIFMVIYYKVFGLVADLVLLANVVLLSALLSMMHATLSLPGIAGILLTVGMAVDANVLIYERIREEIRKGVSPQAAIRAGFEKAFSAIADSNVTTLIAGLVLWIFGTGAIRSFAIVLTLGIATSMFTSLMGSRAVITLIYGGRRKVARLSI